MRRGRSFGWGRQVIPQRSDIADGFSLFMGESGFRQNFKRLVDSDQAVKSRSLYQLSYRGSGRRSTRVQPLEAGSGIEPLYEDLQSWPSRFSGRLEKPFRQ